MNAYTEDVTIVFLLQLDVANALGVRALGNRMLMVIDEFVAVNSDTVERLEEGIDRTVTYTDYAFIFACNRNFTFKTAVDAAISFVKLGEAMTQQLIFAGKVDVFLAEELHNLLAGKFVAIFISRSLHDIAKLG